MLILPYTLHFILYKFLLARFTVFSEIPAFFETTLTFSEKAFEEPGALEGELFAQEAGCRVLVAASTP